MMSHDKLSNFYFTHNFGLEKHIPQPLGQHNAYLIYQHYSFLFLYFYSEGPLAQLSK